MAKEEMLEFDGTVTEVLPDGNFRVKLDNEHEILAYTAGKMRKFRIRTGVGDRVVVEMSPYDLQSGRISFRHKSAAPPMIGSGQRRPQDRRLLNSTPRRSSPRHATRQECCSPLALSTRSNLSGIDARLGITSSAPLGDRLRMVQSKTEACGCTTICPDFNVRCRENCRLSCMTASASALTNAPRVSASRRKLLPGR